MRSNNHSLLSLDTCLTLSLLRYKVGTVYAIQKEQKVTRQQVLEEFDDVFGGFGSLPGKYDIEIDEMVPAVQNCLLSESAILQLFGSQITSK